MRRKGVPFSGTSQPTVLWYLRWAKTSWNAASRHSIWNWLAQDWLTGMAELSSKIPLRINCQAGAQERKLPLPARKSCRRRRTHWQVLGGPPSWAWAAASGTPPSRRTLGSCPCRSDWPAAWPPPSAAPAGRSDASSVEKGGGPYSAGVAPASWKGCSSGALLAFIETTLVNTHEDTSKDTADTWVKKKKKVFMPRNNCVYS